MRAAGTLLVIAGLVILLVGIGMDTTRTTTTCYEADYGWDPADSSGCVETTYSNPLPKFAALMFGFSLLVGGGIVWSQSDGGASTFQSMTQTDSKHQETGIDERGQTTLVEELQAREDDSQSDDGED